MPRRNDVIAEARSWIGTPWKHQGCLKGRACDCVGLVKGVAWGLGLACGTIDAEAYRGYARLPNPETMLAGLGAHLVPIPVEAAGPGDVVLFRIGGLPQHLAILTGPVWREDITIIHSFIEARRVVEQRMPAAWRRQIVRAYSFPGVF